MILNCGEALIDMLPRTTSEGENSFAPHAGGAVFNTAIALGRLGVPSGFFAGLSDDLFGTILQDSLATSHVSSTLCPISDAPTTLAFVTLTDGQAKYAFYDENTALRNLNASNLPDLTDDVSALFFGGISLVYGECAKAYEALIVRESSARVTMIDPNIRPSFIRDEASYRARLKTMISHADIVKLSDEDLVWLEGEGWRRVDPTSWVAPSRVEGGLEAAVDYEGSFLEDSPFSAHNFKWLDGIREKMDAMQYGWRRWILGYDSESQAGLLKSVLDKMSSIPLAALVGALFLGIFLLWFVMLGLGRRQNYEAYEHQLYRKFCKRLEKHGVLREPQQTPYEFALIASRKLPSRAAAIQDFSSLYQQLCYVPRNGAGRDEPHQKMRRLLREIS